MASVPTTAVSTNVSEQPRKSIFSNYLLRRILKAILTVWCVVSLTFFLIRLMPSNPIEVFIENQIAQYGMSYAEARDQARALFAIDLDKPLHEQYLSFLGNLMRGDLGRSFASPGTTVTSIILKFLPWTLFCVGTSLLLSFVMGISLGMLMAYRRHSIIDHVLTVFAALVSAVPNYLIAIMMIVFLGVQWKVINYTKMRGSQTAGIPVGFTWEFFGDVLFHAILPISVYILTTIGGWMLAMKSSTIATLGEDYVTVANARGLKDGRIMTSYVGRNAALPLFTQLTIGIASVVGGSALIENYFVYQGIGQQLIKAVFARDYPVMQGIFLIITFAVITANLFADLLYSRLDPRIRRE